MSNEHIEKTESWRKTVISANEIVEPVKADAICLIIIFGSIAVGWASRSIANWFRKDKPNETEAKKTARLKKPYREIK